MTARTGTRRATCRRRYASERPIRAGCGGPRPVGPGRRELQGRARMAGLLRRRPLAATGRASTPLRPSFRLESDDPARPRGVAAGPDRVPDRRRRDARARGDRVDAQPGAHDHGVVPREGPARRLAARRAPLPAPARRRRRPPERRQLAVGGGHGPDAAPYFRVFNPVTRADMFDPDGDYLRRWVPELAGRRHRVADPHDPGQDGQRAGYPAPIVDHQTERREALDRWQRIRDDSPALTPR